MTTATIERQELDRAIDQLSEDAMAKLAEYIKFLHYEERLEEHEDAEDIAIAEARRNEPDLPFEDLIAKIEAEHGPLD